MKAEARPFTFLANEGVVRVPFFQRTYVWKEENWDDLLADLRQEKRSHFLGSLILKQQRTNSGEPKELLVIDGQQRLTTLSILIKALYDSFPTDVRKNCIDAIRTYLFHKRQRTDFEYAVKIHHSRLDSEAYQSVIRAGIDGEFRGAGVEPNGKILQCYRHFMDELKTSPLEDNIRLFNKVLDSDNKMLVVIDLTEEDDEQSIFDTINSAGVRLSCADIIKNALFQKAILLSNEERAVELYRRTWEKAFMADEETIAYWGTQRLTGRLMRDNIEILLHSIAVIGGFYDPDVHALADLSRLYKDHIEEFKTGEELTGFVRDISDYASIYRERVLSFNGASSFEYADQHTRLFHILEELQISTFHPFILYIFKNGTARGDDRALLDLERFIVRRVIAQQETKSFNKLCKEFIQDPSAIGNRMRETSGRHFSDGLKKISNKHAALLLFWIELLRRHNNKKYDLKELHYNYSLEHVMPQKWEEYWKEMPEKKNMDGSVMSEKDAKEDRNNKVYWIGNMTLLTSTLNSSLRNYDFQRKVKGEGRKRGMKSYAALSITSEDIIKWWETDEQDWNEARIMERTKNLQAEIEQIWGPADDCRTPA